MPDGSNGYEAIAEDFARSRTLTIGPGTVREWAKELRPGASILDLGCGFGAPISEVLLRDGFAVSGVDASPTLVGKFRERFPNAPVECSSVEESRFFDRTFDGVVAWGLLFLLTPEAQRNLIGKVARVLNPHGHFLFTSPWQTGSWLDAKTGLPSISLGRDEYERVLAANGFALSGNAEDEGRNYYYFATRT